MSDDIVTRLRLYANASIDGGWASVFRSDLSIAADEIERLRELSGDAGQLRKERDEAREIACYMFARRNTVNRLTKARSYAQHMGWDCFQEAKQ